MYVKSIFYYFCKVLFKLRLINTLIIIVENYIEISKQDIKIHLLLADSIVRKEMFKKNANID